MPSENRGCADALAPPHGGAGRHYAAPEFLTPGAAEFDPAEAPGFADEGLSRPLLIFSERRLRVGF